MKKYETWRTDPVHLNLHVTSGNFSERPESQNKRA